MRREDVLSVVIVHREQPQRCVRTARAFEAQGVPVRLTVVDNGSTRGALEHLARELPEAEVVALGANRGFGPAANVGLRRWLATGDGDWAAVAAHDALPEPGCLRHLLAAVSDRPHAGLASAVYGELNVGVWLAQAHMKPVVDRYFGSILVAAERTAGWEEAGHPHGTLMLAGRRCLEDVGLFDERYFAYCEEADLGERARRAGWEVGLVWDAVVRNPSMSGASAAVEYLQLRNSLLLVRDHFGRYPAFIRLMMALGDTAVRTLLPPWRTPIFSLPARCRAMVDFGLGRYGPPPTSLLAAAGR
ncbi:MAG: glycosyltransferase [Acidimicrobiia bacterium]|nr:glycosyltransferase [Acidimicrobiia bacterium]